MTDRLDELMSDVCANLADIEVRYGTAPKGQIGGEEKPQLRLLTFDEPEASQDETLAAEASQDEPEGRTIQGDIAAMNDRFRCSEIPDVPGFSFLSPELAELSDAAQSDVWALVRGFEAFTPGDDPDGTHAYGEIDAGPLGRILFRIDCFTSDACTDLVTSDTAMLDCYRVMTVMKVGETMH